MNVTIANEQKMKSFMKGFLDCEPTDHDINEDYSCHLDVEWDNDGSESKLVVKLYIIKDGDVFTTITLDLSKVAHLSDLEIRKLMEESLNKIVEETEDED